MKLFPRYLDITDGVGVIPTKVLQPVPELTRSRYFQHGKY